MSRSISQTARAAIDADGQGIFLILLTLMHGSLAEPIRVTSDSVPTHSRGQNFVPYPFDLRLPDDLENRAPRATLTIDAVDATILRAIEDLPDAPHVLMEIVLAQTPDTVEAAFPDFRLSHIRYSAQKIEGVLTLEDFTAEPYPSQMFTPGLFPAIFR